MFTTNWKASVRLGESAEFKAKANHRTLTCPAAVQRSQSAVNGILSAGRAVPSPERVHSPPGAWKQIRQWTAERGACTEDGKTNCKLTPGLLSMQFLRLSCHDHHQRT